MINIIIKNECLELPDNVSVPFKLQNPMFSTDQIPVPFTFPFQISALSKVNRRLLGRPDDIRNSNRAASRIDCFIEIGTTQYSAYIKLNNSKRLDQYSISIFFTDTSLYDLRDKYLKDIDCGSVNLDEDKAYQVELFSSEESTSVPGAGMTFYLNDIQYEIYYNVGTGKYHEDVYADMVNLINADTSIHGCIADRGPVWRYYQCVRVKSVAHGVGNAFTINKKTTSYPIGDIQVRNQQMPADGTTMVDYMNAVTFGSIVDPPVQFAPIFNDKFYDTGNNPDYKDILNKVTIGTHTVPSDVPFVKNNYYNRSDLVVVPFVRVQYLIKYIYQKLGYSVSGDFFTLLDFKDIVIYNNTALDAFERFYKDFLPAFPTPSYLPVPFEAYFVNVGAARIDFNNHLPAITLSEFNNALKINFGLIIDIDSYSKTIHIDSFNGIVNSKKYTDISEFVEPDDEIDNKLLFPGFTIKYKNNTSDLALKSAIKSIDGYNIQTPVNTQAELRQAGNKQNDLCLVIGENAYYKCNAATSTVPWVWTFYSMNIFDVKYQDGSQQVDTANSTYGMTAFTDTEVGALTPYNLPYMRVLGTSAQFSQEEECELRFMLYRGFEQYFDVSYPGGSGYRQIPYITRGTQDLSGVETFPFSAELDGPKGRFEVLLKKYYEFLYNTVPVKRTFHLPVSKLFNLRWKELYRIEGIDYFIKDISFNVTKTGVTKQVANLLKK